MSIFFTFPENYKSGAHSFHADFNYAPDTPASEISDGRYDTFADGEYFVIDLAGDTHVPLTQLFLRSTGVTHVTVSSPSGVLANRVGVPTDLSGHTLVVNGINHAHIPFGTFNDNELRLRFEGTNQRIYNVALCDSGPSIGPHGVWQEIRNRRVDRTSVKRTNIRGEFITTRGRGDRWKWITEYTGIFVGNPAVNNQSPAVERMMQFLEENPNFFYLPNQAEFPYLFYPATLEESAFEINYIGRQYYQQQVSLTIAEM